MSAPRTLMRYCSPTLMTMGWYGSSTDAKRACSEVGAWVETEPGSDNWRSDDSRWLILDEGPRNKALNQRDADAFRRRYDLKVNA